MLIVKVKNVTGTFNVADYVFEIWVNDEMIFVGKIKDFNRKGLNYSDLLVAIATNMRRNGDPGVNESAIEGVGP